MDEELRLIATFQDRIGPGLKGSIDKIRQFTKEGVRGAEEGEKSVKKHAKAFQELREKIKYTADLTRESFLPGLEKTALTAATAGIGIGSLAAAIGLAASAAKGFGETMLELQRGSRQTGLSVEDLRKWQNFGEIVGTTGERMREGLSGFNALVELMDRRPDRFRQMFAGFDMAGMAALRDFMLSMKDLPRDQQIEKILEFVRSIKDVGQQKTVLEALKLPPELAGQLQNMLRDEAAAKAGVTDLTQAQKDMGEQAGKNWIELGQKFQDLSIVIGAKFSPAMSEATQELRDFIIANQAAWSADADAWFKDAVKAGGDFVKMLQQITDFLNKITEWESKPHFTPPINPNALPPDLDEKRRQFEKLNPGGLIHKSAFMVGGDEGGAGAGVSKGTSDMINIIAQGTRRGVYDGLMDFSQTPAGAGGGGGGGGIMNASLGGGGTGAALSGIRARAIGGKLGGNEAVLAQQGYDYWRSQGLSRDQALSVLGNQRGENQLGSLNTAGGSGQFQWDATRRRQIFEGTGIDVRTAGFLDQQRAARWEMENSPDKINRVWSQLKASTSRDAAVGALVHQYERSLNQGSDISIREGFADRYGRSIIDKPDAVAGAGAGAAAAAKSFSMPHRPGHTPAPVPHQYDSPFGHAEQQASLLRSARQANAGSSTLKGEASLSIKLAGGLAPDGGAKTRGDLFKEIKISRGSIPYASTEA